MIEHIKNFVNYEEPNQSHKQVVSSIITYTVLLLPLLYVFSYNERWLAYSLMPGTIIGVVWGIIIYRNIEYKRKQYYLYCGIMKVFTCFLFVNFGLSIITATLDVQLEFYICIYFIIIVLLFVFYFLNRKNITEKGVKNKNYNSISFGTIFVICFLGQRMIRNLISRTGKTLPLIVVAFLTVYLAFISLNKGTKDILKYQFIKQLEKEN